MSLLTLCVLAGSMQVAVAETKPAKAPAKVRAAGDDLKVTFAARQCADYSDIMANLARNNIQESLRDLGKDSEYVSGQPVNPAVEEPNDPDCKPLVGWKFQWGSGIGGKTDLLSTVSGPLAQTPATKTSTPLLDAQGKRTGKNLAAAVTVPLDDQLRQLVNQGSLWVQGGSTTDPLMNSVFGRGKYGFGALRCSVDNLNGDNVETVAFPADQTHVFCYYYAVTPPPGAGHIVVRKKVEGGGSDSHQFDFHGNVSYNPGGTFDLDASPSSPGQINFDRGETRSQDDPWDFTEDVPAGWKLESVTCDSAKGTSTSQVSGAHVSVTLAADDTVTCTYTDKRVFATGLTVYKRTLGRAGGPFAFKVTRPNGSTDDLGSVTTRTEGTPTQAGQVDNAEAGTYTITETLPDANAGGSWTPVSVECVDVDDSTHAAKRTRARGAEVSYQVDLDAKPANCLFTNRFHPTHRLRIEKKTIGGYMPAAFQVRALNPLAEAAARRSGPQRVTVTTRPGHNPAGITQTKLPTGAYFITELRHSSPNGTWRLTAIVCDGRHFPISHATGAVLLTDAHPNHVCRFTNVFTPYPHLKVDKRIRDPRGLRTGPVTIIVKCADGQQSHLTVSSGQTGLFHMKPLTLPTRTTCRVTETTTGASGPIRVRTTHQTGHRPPRKGTTTRVTAGGTGRDVTVHFMDTYYTHAHIKDS